jgi:hypothetical protein
VEIDTPVVAALGALVVAGTLADVVRTTIGVGSGRGPLSDHLAHGLWSLAKRAGAGHRGLRAAGVVIAVAVPVLWLLLTWAGFALVFLADDDAVVVAATQEPTATLGRIAFAAGGLAGAGAGLVAGTETWQLVNNVSALVGLGLVTLSLTYLFQVVTAVTSERSAVSRLAALGPAPEDILRRALTAPGLGSLPLQLVGIADAVSLAAQQHLALPLLQFFHSADRSTSVPLNLARLDDALSLLEHGLATPAGPTVAAGRRAVDAFVGTLRLTGPLPDVPPLPLLVALRDAAEHTVGDDAFAAAMEDEAERRQRLHAFVLQEGWAWDDLRRP